MTKTVSKQWQAKFRSWVGASEHGLLCTGVRRRGRGVWISPGDAPQEVRQYLALKKRPTADHWCCEEFNSLEALHSECESGCRTSLTNQGLLAWVTVDEPVPVRLIDMGKMIHKLARRISAGDLFQIYRAAYKASDCGVSVGFLLTGLPPDSLARPRYGNKPAADDPIWIYCDGLLHLPSLEHLYVEGMRVVSICVTAYVEGVDWHFDPILVKHANKRATVSDFWAAVNLADSEANDVWLDTHGCEQCGSAGETGYRMVNPDCLACGGQGVIL